MGRRKKIIGPNQHLYSTTDHYVMPNGRIIEQGEIIKIQGIWGSKFKFHNYVVRTDTGIDWIDCFQLVGDQVSVWRSFRTDRIKPISKKNKRVKNENR